MAQDNESSVEEILDSIRKVIARDNREGAIKSKRRRQIVPEETVMDPDTPEEPQISSVNEQDLDEVLDLGAMEFLEDDQSGDAFFEPSDEGDEDDAEHGHDHEAPLIKDELRGEMQDNLAALAMLAEPGAKPQIVRSGETSLEGLTRELLRPMLAEWLDQNLPAMVEKMVQAEISRIAGKRR